MRPIRLEVEGFTCYRERQAPLDFTGLSLFAIAGPTGAGKSSILDAMLYALYGEIPRLGAQGKTEIISQGRDALSVLLDFEVQDRQYRVTRRVKRRAKSPAQSIATFAALTGGTERSIADGVRGVNDAVVQVLGLSYEDFTQTVVLPQGEFAKFLQADPKGQREILQRLLRHQVFERMRQTADERRRQLDSERQRIEGQLDRCVDATEEALTAKESDLAAAHARQAAATVEKTTAEEAFDATRRGREVTVALEQCRRQWKVIEAQTADIEQARIEQASARRAATIVPRLDTCRDAESRVAGSRREQATAEVAVTRTEVKRREAVTRLEAAVKEALACDGLAQKIRRLDEIAGDLIRRAELTAAAGKLPKHVAAAERDLDSARRREETARDAVTAFDAQLQTLDAELAHTAVDEDLLARLDALRDDGARVRGLDRELTVAKEELARCEATQADAERRLEALQRAETAAQDSALAAAAARDQARTAFEDTADRHRAGSSSCGGAAVAPARGRRLSCLSSHSHEPAVGGNTSRIRCAGIRAAGRRKACGEGGRRPLERRIRTGDRS
jgi:DNA repair protein SbcC/Rad50